MIRCAGASREYYEYLKLQLYSEQDFRIFLGLMQLFWEQGESAAWLKHVNDVVPANTPADKRVLLFAAFGDAQVSCRAAGVAGRCHVWHVLWRHTACVRGACAGDANRRADPGACLWLLHCGAAVRTNLGCSRSRRAV